MASPLSMWPPAIRTRSSVLRESMISYRSSRSSLEPEKCRYIIIYNLSCVYVQILCSFSLTAYLHHQNSFRLISRVRRNEKCKTAKKSIGFRIGIVIMLWASLLCVSPAAAWCRSAVARPAGAFIGRQRGSRGAAAAVARWMEDESTSFAEL